MQKQDLLPAVAVVAALAVSATATDVFAAKQDRFPIDLGELRAKAEERFNAADADGDGSVSAEEFANADLRGVPRGRRDGGRRHGDAEGRPAREWARAGQEGVFDAADADANGQLSEEEFNAVPAAVRSQRQQRLFERLDADASGGLSLAEFPSRLKRLEMLDANADGTVSRDEMPLGQRPQRRRH